MRTLNDTENSVGSPELLAIRLEQYNVHICGLSEVRWPGKGIRKVGTWDILFSGRKDGMRCQGVGLALSPEARNSFLDWGAVNERIVWASFSAGGRKLVFLQAYAPTDNAEPDDKDTFYGHLQQTLDMIPDRDILIFGGDFNAQLGGQDVSCWAGCLGPFALGNKHTDNANRLLEFCTANGLVVRSTFFKHKREHLATWRSNAQNAENQIDHFLVRRNHARLITDCRTYRGAQFDSDHYLLICACTLHFRQYKPRPRPPRFGVHVLKDREHEATNAYCQSFEAPFTSIAQNPLQSPDQEWESLKAVLQDSGKRYLPAAKRPKKPEISPATLELIDQKRVAYQHYLRARGGAGEAAAKRVYRNINNQCRTSVLKDRKEYWKSLAADLQRAFKDRDLHLAYKRLYELPGFRPPPLPGATRVQRADGSLAEERKECDRLKTDFFSTLLNCQRDIHPCVWEHLPEPPNPAENCREPTLSDVEAALDKLKNNKAAGICNILPEMLKYGGEALAQWLHRVITAVWRNGRSPADWKRALIVPILKKGDPAVLDNYRGISLQSLPGKVYALVLRKKFEQWAASQLSEVQCGFRRGRGCADAIHCLRSISETAVAFKRPISACFFDISKAYDSADRSVATRVLRSRGAPQKLVELLHDLHVDTQCALRDCRDSPAAWFTVRTGFKQGDVNAPTLFNLYVDTILRCCEPLVRQLGVRIGFSDGGHLRECRRPTHMELIWIFMYADDIVLLAEDPSALQQGMNIMDDTFRQWGMIFSIPKTKVMVMGPTAGNEYHFTLRDTSVEVVRSFKYLGCICASDSSIDLELAHRLSSANFAFFRLGKTGIWGSRDISRNTQCTIFKTVVLTTLLYCCELWALTAKDVNRLEVFQMKCLRRIYGVSLLQKIRNTKIREHCGVPALTCVLRYRRLKWLGHIGRMDLDRLPRQLLACSIEGHRPVGRPQKCWIDCVREDLASIKSQFDWHRTCQDKATWAARIKRVLQ